MEWEGSSTEYSPPVGFEPRSMSAVSAEGARRPCKDDNRGTEYHEYQDDAAPFGRSILGQPAVIVHRPRHQPLVGILYARLQDLISLAD